MTLPIEAQPGAICPARSHSPDTGAREADPGRPTLKTIPDPNPHLCTVQEHLVGLPELCPATRNPGAGSRLRIRYRSRGAFLEVFALCDYIQGFIGDTRVRDVEMLTQVVARDCAQILGHKVRVEGHYLLPALGHTVRTRVVAKP